MDNVTFVDIEIQPEVFVTYAIIDRGNEEFTSMTKAHYDAQQEHLTENPTEDVE